MRSLIRRDPAPSRWAYRRQRLMLTPLFRFFLKYGLPVGILGLATGLYFAEAERREAMIVAAGEIRRQIEERPEFMVNLMAIDGASAEVAEDIREIVPLDFPISSFDLELTEIKERAEELDAVARADVRIRSGGVLQLDIAERTPAVVWRTEDGLELLDAEGHRVAELARRADRPDLPLLAGAAAEDVVPEALTLLQLSAPIERRIRGLLRVGERRWDVVLDKGQRIMLPEADPMAALQRVIALDQARDLLARDLTVVDMRNPDRPTLRLGQNAVETFREIIFAPKEPTRP
ncbi:MAG: cell division protein FtsQ [Rhodobacteraceae bacterium]|nr:cell division protein FtsQ [Paracoccaceae bacterium]